MGRTFENRKHAIAKRGARDAKAFTKAGRQLAMATRSGGPDPEANPALRRAIQNARAVNMPKDKIQNAIEKASGAGSTEDFQEATYEGYGPHGIAVIVTAATDNPTRTVSSIRSHFKKGGGTLGNENSVSFLFDYYGSFVIAPDGQDREELELELIDHGLEQLDDTTTEKNEPAWLALCARESFGALQTALEERKANVVTSGFTWIPKAAKDITEEQAKDLEGLLERLDDDDDVQDVYCDVGDVQ